MQQDTREPVRLVIWDLDRTFWDGTLTEEGYTYRQDVHDIVVALAERGIVSSICSKNDYETVKPILVQHGIWDYFVLPSINWEPKGPRLAAIVEAFRLRAPTILFIDDNAANLAEAQAALPGLQVADETVVPTLLESRLLRGKPDPAHTRLQHYRMLEQRHADQTSAAASDNTNFLRDSDIRVSIDHDIETHIDRAIELINRTNQLNFIKQRLPEDIQAAGRVLRDMLAGFRVQAGLIRVRDRYGDHGFCGFYAISTGGSSRVLQQFCFSCRILNMGVEAWLYQRLGSPRLRVQGEVLSDPTKPQKIDWITLEPPGGDAAAALAAPEIAHVFARGGCELNATMHYFSLVADQIVGEFDALRDGKRMIWQHSMFARYAIEGIGPEQRQAACSLGYGGEDYNSYLAKPVTTSGTAVWIFSFVADAGAKLYRHRQTGVMLPLAPTAQMMADDGPKAPLVDPAIAGEIAANWEFLNDTPEPDFKYNLRLILGQAPPGTHIFIILPKEGHLNPQGAMYWHKPRVALNKWTLEVIADFPQVQSMRIVDFCADEERLKPGTHYDRMTYYRIYAHISAAIRR
jgi:FkbH-like protein